MMLVPLPLSLIGRAMHHAQFERNMHSKSLEAMADRGNALVSDQWWPSCVSRGASIRAKARHELLRRRREAAKKARR